MKKYAIYEAEYPIHKPGRVTGLCAQYHASLQLVEESKGCLLDKEGGPYAVDALHFVDQFDLADGLDKLTSYVKKGVYRKDELVILQGYVGGDEETVLGFWNRALKAALATRRLKAEFNLHVENPLTYNCRSGAEAAIQAMGFKFMNVGGEKTSEGLGAGLYERIERAVASYDSGGNILELRRNRRRLTSELG